MMQSVGHTNVLTLGFHLNNVLSYLTMNSSDHNQKDQMVSSTLYENKISFFYSSLRNIKLDCLRRMQRIININISPRIQNLHHVRACIQLQHIEGSVLIMRKSYKIIHNYYQNDIYKWPTNCTFYYTFLIYHI